MPGSMDVVGGSRREDTRDSPEALLAADDTHWLALGSIPGDTRLDKDGGSVQVPHDPQLLGSCVRASQQQQLSHSPPLPIATSERHVG